MSQLDNGDLPITEAKELFGRCRLYIAPHGAALANIVFMPKFGEILEMRPSSYYNPVYHYLAHICELKYYLILGNGTKNSEIQINQGEVVALVSDIVKRSKIHARQDRT